jgi:hypothetical protein
VAEDFQVIVCSLRVTLIPDQRSAFDLDWI